MNFSTFFNEARRRVDVNTKDSVLDTIRKYKDRPDVLVSFRDYVPFNKPSKKKSSNGTIDVGVKINPKNDFNTPTGVYGYVVAPMWNKHFLTKSFPFAGDRPVVYIYTPKSGTRAIYSGNYTKEDYEKDSKKVQEVIGADDATMDNYLENVESNVWAHSYFRKIWALTQDVARLTATTRQNVQWSTRCPYCAAWSLLFVKIGIHVVIDDAGTQTVHENEPFQAVLFGKQYINVIDKIENKNWNYVGESSKQKIIDNINDKLSLGKYPTKAIDTGTRTMDDLRKSSIYHNIITNKLLHAIPVAHFKIFNPLTILHRNSNAVRKAKKYGLNGEIYPTEWMNFVFSIIQNISNDDTDKLGKIQLVELINCFTLIRQNYQKPLTNNERKAVIRRLLSGPFILQQQTTLTDIAGNLTSTQDARLKEYLYLSMLKHVNEDFTPQLIEHLVHWLYASKLSTKTWMKIATYLSADGLGKDSNMDIFFKEIAKYMHHRREKRSLFQYAPDNFANLLNITTSNRWHNYCAVFLGADHLNKSLSDEERDNMYAEFTLNPTGSRFIGMNNGYTTYLYEKWYTSFDIDSPTGDRVTQFFKTLSAGMYDTSLLVKQLSTLSSPFKTAIFRSGNETFIKYLFRAALDSDNESFNIDDIQPDILYKFMPSVIESLPSDALQNLMYNKTIDHEKIFTQDVLLALFDNTNYNYAPLPTEIWSFYNFLMWWKQLIPLITKYEKCVEKIMENMPTEEGLSKKELTDILFSTFDKALTATSDYFSDEVSHQIFTKTQTAEAIERTAIDGISQYHHKTINGFILISNGSHYIKWAKEFPTKVYRDNGDPLYQGSRAKYFPVFMRYADWKELYPSGEKLAKALDERTNKHIEWVNEKLEEIAKIPFEEENQYYVSAPDSSDILIPLGRGIRYTDDHIPTSLLDILNHKEVTTTVDIYMEGGYGIRNGYKGEQPELHFVEASKWKNLFGTLPQFYQLSVSHVRENLLMKYELLAANPPKNIPTTGTQPVDAYGNRLVFLGQGSGKPHYTTNTELMFFKPDHTLRNLITPYTYDSASDRFVLAGYFNEKNKMLFTPEKHWITLIGKQPPEVQEGIYTTDTTTTLKSADVDLLTVKLIQLAKQPDYKLTNDYVYIGHGSESDPLINFLRKIDPTFSENHIYRNIAGTMDNGYEGSMSTSPYYLPTEIWNDLVYGNIKI